MRSLHCVAALLAATAPLSAQDTPHALDPARAVGAFTAHAGASAILAAVRVAPGVANRTLAEGYLTQPLLHGGARYERILELRAMVNLEGATLRRGELTPGIYGEGYVDRRHPHTYLHELVATVRTPVWSGAAASLSGGKGFAPFGTDDPMVRPLLRYPVNHHLAQILERAFVSAALRWRGVAVEAGLFNGDEPETPSDAPNAVNWADSWATRATLWPVRGVELQGSVGLVRSPESPIGYGFDHRRRHLSARVERNVGRQELYALVEWARTELMLQRTSAFRLSSALAEASATRGRLTIATRFERTTRPEEERLVNPFRTQFPTAEVHVLGITRISVATAAISSRTSVRGLAMSPFVEGSLVRSRETVRPSAFVPLEFYGRNPVAAVSLGVRLGVGRAHGRMGRYGVAEATGTLAPGAPTTHH